MHYPIYPGKLLLMRKRLMHSTVDVSSPDRYGVGHRRRGKQHDAITQTDSNVQGAT